YLRYADRLDALGALDSGATLRFLVRRGAGLLRFLDPLALGRDIGGAPEIPARDAAIRLPAPAALFHLVLRRCAAIFLECKAESLAHAEIVERQHIGPAEAEDQQHLDRPAADAAHLRQLLDDRLVFETIDIGEMRDFAGRVAPRQIADRQELRLRETRAAQLRVAGLDDLCRGRRLMRLRIERAEPREDRSRSLGVKLLIDDRLGEGDEDARRAPDLHTKRADRVDETPKRWIGVAQIVEREGRIERQHAVALE